MHSFQKFRIASKFKLKRYKMSKSKSPSKTHKKRIKSPKTSKSSQNSSSIQHSEAPASEESSPETHLLADSPTGEALPLVQPTESEPFTPVDNPYEHEFSEEPPAPPIQSEQVADNASHYPKIETPLSKEQEGFLGEYISSFEDSEGVSTLNHDGVDNNNPSDTEGMDEVLATVNLEDLPTIPGNESFCTNSSQNGESCQEFCGLDTRIPVCCGWWKARSVACSKCMVQPLYIRPRPTGGGYGKWRTTNNSETKCEKIQQNGPDCSCIRICKVVPGLCSECSQQQTSQESRQNSKRGHNPHRRYSCNTHSKSNRDPCNCAGKSEYQCAYAHPADQAIIRKRHRKNLQRSNSVRDEDAYLVSLYKLLHRPPFNLYAQPEEILWTETISASEAKLRALDALEVERRRLREERRHARHPNRHAKSKSKTKKEVHAKKPSDDSEKRNSDETELRGESEYDDDSYESGTDSEDYEEE